MSQDPSRAAGGAPATDGFQAAMAALRERRYPAAEARLTQILAAAPTSEAYLLRSAAREKLGRRAEARDDLLAAARPGPNPHDPAVLCRAATRLVKLGATGAGLALLRDHLPRHPELRRLLANLCLDAGRIRDGLEAMRPLAAKSPEHAITLAGWLRGFGDAEAALATLDDALRDQPTGAHLDRARRLRLQALGDLERYDEARQVLASLEPTNLEDALDDARVALRLGDFDDARRRLAALAETHPESPEVWSALGDLAAWRADLPAIHQAADTLARLDPEHPSGPRLRGIAHALAGERAEARGALDHCLSLEPTNPEALLWRGEIARAEGDLASSLQDLDAGITASHGYPIAGHLSRVITVTAAHQRHKGRELLTTHEDAFAELATILAPLLPTLAQSPGGRRLTADLLRDFEQALARMGGNRSTRPTYLEGGPSAEVELRPLDVPVHTRFKARQIQDLLPVRDPEDVIARLQALADERDAEPTIFCHIGEIHLWLGDPDRAEAAFLRAIRDTPEVRWAYVGLCATQLLRDDPQGAVRWCDRGIDAFPPPGRTIYAYRGEAHRRLGELDRAEDDLRQILELTPERISAWLNLALVGSARDDRRMLDPVFRKTARRAPALVDDACHELGLDPLVLPSDDDLVRLFEHILHMMRGNRSSNFVSYFTAAGDLRFVPR